MALKPEIPRPLPQFSGTRWGRGQAQIKFRGNLGTGTVYKLWGKIRTAPENPQILGTNKVDKFKGIWGHFGDKGSFEYWGFFRGFQVIPEKLETILLGTILTYI